MNGVIRFLSFHILCAVALLLFAGSTALAQSRALYLPALQATEAGDLGIGLSNPTLSEVAVTLAAHAYDGRLILGRDITNPVTLRLPASGQLARRTVEIFGLGIRGKAGWVEIKPSIESVKGFFILFDRDVSYMDGLELRSAPARSLVFPKVNDSTKLTFVHTGSDAATIQIELYENTGTLFKRWKIPMAPSAGFSGALSQLDITARAFTGYAVVETSSPSLIGFETYGSGDLAALSGADDTGRAHDAYLTHFISGSGYYSLVGLVNPTGVPQTVRITAGLERGEKSIDRQIPAFGRLEERVDALFDLGDRGSATGYIRYTVPKSGDGLVGYIEYGTADGKLLTAAPAQGAAYSEFFFSHVAEGLGYYTGLAFFNPHSEEVSLRFDVMSEDGRRTGSTAITLQPGERRSRLLNQIATGIDQQLGGYIRVTSQRPVFSLQIFGLRAPLRTLSNIPAQGIFLRRQANGQTVRRAAGAQVVTSDGAVSLNIQPQALEADSAIRIDALNAARLEQPFPDQHITAAVEARPVGTRFLVPAQLRFPTGIQLEPGTQLPVLVRRSERDRFEASGLTAVVDETGLTAWTEITQFATFALAVPTKDFINVTATVPSIGKAGDVITIKGDGFSRTAADNRVAFSAANAATLFAEVIEASENSLTVVVPKGAVTGAITVRTGSRGSLLQPFTVPLPTPSPVITSISPPLITNNSAPAEIEITGSGFQPGSTVTYDAVPVTRATFVDPTSIVVTLDALQLNSGVHRMQVMNSNPAAVSNIVELTVRNPAPSITELKPATAFAGTSIEVTIIGTGFVPSSTVTVDGSPNYARFVDSHTLRIILNSSTGTIRQISVINSVPGGGESTAATFTFVSPPPPPPPATTAAPALPPPPAPVPAQAPQVSGPKIVSVRSGDNLQSALDAAQPGDIIELEAGGTFTGPFTLPNKSGSGEILIRSSAYDRLPAAAGRVGISDAAAMPKIVASTEYAIATSPGAHDFRFIGIEIAPSRGTFMLNVVLLGSWPWVETSTDKLPRNIVIDRCYIHGDPQVGSLRGIALNGINVTVTGSYISDFKQVNRDTQAILGWNGPGPFLIENNYLEAAGENIMFGGGDPSIPDLVPSDIKILRNRLAKPLSWKVGHPTYQGTHWSVKNLLELKNARRVLIDGNVLEYNWADAQNGYAVLFTPRNQDGNSPWSVVEDVVMTNNIIRHTTSGFNIMGWDNLHPSQQTKRIRIQNNLLVDVGGSQWGQQEAFGLGAGSVFQLLDGTKDVVIEHNTAFETTGVLVGGGTTPAGPHTGEAHTGFIFRNNLMMNGTAGVLGAGTNSVSEALARYFRDSLFEANVLIGGNPTLYPSNNFFPLSPYAVGFVDYPGGNFRLSQSSPYRSTGTDKQNIGLTDSFFDRF